MPDAPSWRPMRYRCTCGAVVIAATDRAAHWLMRLHHLDVGGTIDALTRRVVAPPGHRGRLDPLPDRTPEAAHA